MTKTTILTKELILQAKDLPIELVEVPEWGGSVYVRGLTGAERDSFEAGIVQLKGKSQTVNMKNVRAKLLQLTIVDENGNRLFNVEEIASIGAKSAMALERLFNVASRLSGITPEDAEELAKNSESDQSGDFTSD